jgi:hypothetical protein
MSLRQALQKTLYVDHLVPEGGVAKHVEQVSRNTNQRIFVSVVLKPAEPARMIVQISRGGEIGVSQQILTKHLHHWSQVVLGKLERPRFRRVSDNGVCKILKLMCQELLTDPFLCFLATGELLEDRSESISILISCGNWKPRTQ